MRLVKLKLIETITKSLFYLLIIYLFPIKISGIFGFLTVLIGLSTVFIGFERYISFQREIVKIEEIITQSKITNLLIFYLINFIIILPFFSAVIYFKIYENIDLIFFTLIILFVEHISTQIYNISVVFNRYIDLMKIVIIKNIALISLTIYLIIEKETNSLKLIIIGWFVLSIFQLIICWFYFNNQQKKFRLKIFPIKVKEVFSQFNLSKIHFLIGLVAIVWIQLDRIVVGLWFSPERMGVYYRHVALIGILYQIFNIVSYNRLIPLVYGSAKNQAYSFINNTLLKEYRLIIISLLIISLMIYVTFKIDFFKDIFNNLFLELKLLLMLIIVFSIKIFADFRAMILNAFVMEKIIFKNQIRSLSFGLILMFILIPHYEIYGIVMASMISTILYAILMFKDSRLTKNKLNENNYSTSI